MGSEIWLLTGFFWVPSLIHLIGMLVKLIGVPTVTEVGPTAEPA